MIKFITYTDGLIPAGLLLPLLETLTVFTPLACSLLNTVWQRYGRRVFPLFGASYQEPSHSSCTHIAPANLLSRCSQRCFAD